MDIQIEPIPDGEKPPQGNITTVPINPNPTEHLVIADRFNVTNPTKEESHKLQTIWDYIKARGSEKETRDLIWDVINLEGVVGSPRLGETRLDKVYKYVRLRVDEARIQEQLKNTVM